MPFSRFPFQRISYILWLPNSGLCAEKLFYAYFFTWSKANVITTLREEKELFPFQMDGQYRRGGGKK